MGKKSIRLITVTILGLVSVWMSSEMILRGQQQLLWGYRPLILFLAGWGTFVLAFFNLISSTKNNNRWLGLSTLSAIILGLGFPDILPMPFLMFIGFVPLLVVEQEVRQSETKNKFWTTFKLSYHTFITWNILSTYWVANASIGAGLFAIMVNALLMTVPFMLYHLSQTVMPKLSYIALTVFWITFEYNHLNWELSWPWLNLGNSFAEYPSWIQWYEYTGTFGGTLWILMINILLFERWLNRATIPVFKLDVGLLKLILLLILQIGFSFLIYSGHEDDGKKVKVAIVQPNYEPHYEKFSTPKPMQMTRYLKLASEVIDEATAYLVFPESSFGYAETHTLNHYPSITRLKSFLKDYPNTNIITGLNAYTEFQTGEALTINTRTNVNPQGDTTFYEVLNIAVQLNNEQDSIPIYKKSKLVPGPEIFPYQKLLFLFKPIVDKLGGTTAGIGTQKKPTAFGSTIGQIGTAICYESVFGEYFAGYVKAGAEAIFIITNDGWWDNTAGHRQHLRFASLRAIETRKSIARSAYTGISAFINQRGDIINPTEYNEMKAITGEIVLNDRKTFYVLWGNIIARVALFVSMLLILNLLVRFWQFKFNRP